jgi:small subunit ribosomal protein S17
MESTNNQKTKKVRKLEGVITSHKMNKTRTVEVSWLKKHHKYLKYFKRTSKFKAHDENNEYKEGDKVVIEETRPISKDKRWKIVKKLENINPVKQ